MFLIRNYNRFLTTNDNVPQWIDLYIHRFRHDLNKLMHFNSRAAAEGFLAQHPDLELEFSAWVVEFNPADWNH